MFNDSKKFSKDSKNIIKRKKSSKSLRYSCGTMIGRDVSIYGKRQKYCLIWSKFRRWPALRVVDGV